MKLGSDFQEITPPLPIYLGGYIDRDKPAETIAENLYLQTYFFKNEKKKLVLLTLDLIIFDDYQIKACRSRIAEFNDVNEEDIVISCTHTHSGPALRKELIKETKKAINIDNYFNYLKEVMASSVYKAHHNLKKVKNYYNKTNIKKVASNRRSNKTNFSNPLSTIFFIDKNKEITEILTHFPCHPTVLGAENLQVSADYPGYLKQVITKSYPIATVGFLNGAAGDISTRFHRKEQTHQEAQRIGYLLGGKSLSLLSEGNSFKTSELKSKQVKFEADFKDLPSSTKIDSQIDELKTKLDKLLDKENVSPGKIRQTKTALQGAQIQHRLKEKIKKLNNTIKINLWILGEIALVFIPGELFSSLGYKIKAASPFPFTLIVGLSYGSGHIGYIPDKISYDEGGYEPFATPLAKGNGERLISKIIKELKKLE